MKSRSLLLGIVPLVLGCNDPSVATHSCASIYSVSSTAAASFCATFTASTVTATTAVPSALLSNCGNTKALSSACSCLSTTTGAASTTTSSTSKATTTTTATKTTTSGSSGSGTTCTVTAYASISSAVKSCSTILLSNISAPPSSTIDLQKLQTGAAVIFAGTTTFGTTADDSFDPIVISGTDVTITGAAGHVIDGNGPAYWDGQGSNGGSSKPDHFIVAKKMYSSTISNLNIKNWPVHCFDIENTEDLTISGLTLDNSAGDAPNSASGSLPAAHNSDGFDIKSSTGLILENTWVHNQDDCVAVTSGTDITVTGMYCYGGHGLSIGSIGGKSDNTVDGVTFSNSQVLNSENGCRIKTNSGTTGSVSNITYQNITLSGITSYGIDVQQDYLNGGPTGTPTNGVTIAGVSFINVKGTMSKGKDYYILCGSGSCSNFSFSGVSITGGSGDSCNYPSSGCP